MHDGDAEWSTPSATLSSVFDDLYSRQNTEGRFISKYIHIFMVECYENIFSRRYILEQKDRIDTKIDTISQIINELERHLRHYHRYRALLHEHIADRKFAEQGATFCPQTHSPHVWEQLHPDSLAETEADIEKPEVLLQLAKWSNEFISHYEPELDSLDQHEVCKDNEPRIEMLRKRLQYGTTYDYLINRRLKKLEAENRGMSKSGETPVEQQSLPQYSSEAEETPVKQPSPPHSPSPGACQHPDPQRAGGVTGRISRLKSKFGLGRD